jgi:hypothetical protein
MLLRLLRLLCLLQQILLRLRLHLLQQLGRLRSGGRVSSTAAPTTPAPL